ncbi:MAG: hypothetical protein K2G35_02375 [Duncaniella sp.]|nr:hypothetical protein [Duncaniella sp.]
MMTNTAVFINNIITPQLTEHTNIAQLVSGIPSAFARVDLFKNAIDHLAVSTGSADTNSLLSYYRRLVDEWKGLIACLALDYAHVTARRIDLKYSDGKTPANTANVYEPKGAFGNMLLERRQRWCEQNLPANTVAVPFINVIKYRGKVVGATAPECLVFTSSGYKIDETNQLPWVKPGTGKFTDPLNSELTEQQTATLHAYVEHLIKNLSGVAQYYSGLTGNAGVNYNTIQTILTSWRDKIAKYAENNGFNLSIGSTPPVNLQLAGPFKILLCHKDILYGLEGAISESPSTGAIKFDPQDLLLDDSAHIARLGLNVSRDDIQNLPVLVLMANVKGVQTKVPFALPLSALGLNVFGRNVGALTNTSDASTAIPSTLRAEFDPSLTANNLEVVLTLHTASGGRRELKRVYTCDAEIANNDILIWPNFVSPQWNAYFLYSELPHNGTSSTYRAFPFLGEMRNGSFRIIVDANNNPVLLSGNSVVNGATILVENNTNVNDNSYKYEIFRSTRPFKGVRLLSPSGHEGGFLLINYSSALNTTLPRDMMDPNVNAGLNKVNLGIDFGSTNTSVAYSDGLSEKGFTFKSQRISLLGNDNRPTPHENQVFFFPGPGVEVKSNAIKSVLTLHDKRRLSAPAPTESLSQRNSREVVGGFPCFADNLPFVGSDDKSITLNFPNGVGNVTQVHNMKWVDTDEDKAYKSAFLRTLLLQIDAHLFLEGMVPVSIKWSYPSAMSGQILFSYDGIWSGLSQVRPVLDPSGQPYPLNVSRYNPASIALGDGFDRTTGNDVQPESGFGGGGGFGGSATFGGGFDSADGFGGGGFGGGGFGGEETIFGDGGGAEQKPQTHVAGDLLPDDPERKVSYNPVKIYELTTPQDNPSLSEAEAVANFISSKQTSANLLYLCFDLGGTTTDISSLFMLKNKITMIKQNSLRFAAQRVSQAVGHFPSFKKVLRDVCANNNIRMVGLNFGPDTYNPQTASYYFDQVVNKLDDDQLSEFYRTIMATCPQMMCVNLYVTGLLMFYAGQLAHKLIDDLNRTNSEEWAKTGKPGVFISFAGKGSRLYQWLQTISQTNAKTYYEGMFLRGFGSDFGKLVNTGACRIELPHLHETDIKYEVSKGLAKGETELHRPSEPQKSEIIGENGFSLVGNDHQVREVNYLNTLTPAMMENIGIRFNMTGEVKAEKFTTFCEFFYSAAHHLCGWNVNPKLLENACREINITGFTQNTQEFREARREAHQSGQPFNFAAPIIILEGMAFFEKTLLKLLEQ